MTNANFIKIQLVNREEQLQIIIVYGITKFKFLV